MEDGGERQLPGNARAADRWRARSVGLPEAPGGWGMAVRQQAGAFCRVNCAQPTGRASGVRCTPWFGGGPFSQLSSCHSIDQKNRQRDYKQK